MYTGGHSDTALLENMGTAILKDNLVCREGFLFLPCNN
jgi:hypothetical protein